MQHSRHCSLHTHAHARMHTRTHTHARTHTHRSHCSHRRCCDIVHGAPTHKDASIHDTITSTSIQVSSANVTARALSTTCLQSNLSTTQSCVVLPGSPYSRHNLRSLEVKGSITVQFTLDVVVFGQDLKCREVDGQERLRRRSLKTINPHNKR